MVAASKDRSGGRSSSKSAGMRQFAHPLLRIAAQVGDTQQTYRAFHRLVRRALEAPERSQERARLAVEVLDTLNDLRLDRESAEAFRLEWLQSVTQSVECATLFEALGMAEIANAGLSLPESVWQTDKLLSEGLTVIRLVRVEARKDSSTRHPSLPLKAFQALICCVDAALDAHREASLCTWSGRDCLAVLRAIALLSVLDQEYQPARQLENSQHYFLQVGQGLWTLVAEHLSTLPEAPEHASFWDGSLQRRVALHARGRAYVDKVGSPSTEAEGDQPASTQPGSYGWLKVVHGPIPPATYKDDTETLSMYAPLLTPQRVAAMPMAKEVDAVLNALSQEFPWATSVVDELGSMMRARSLFGVQELCLSPVLIVGYPGAGKSRFVRRLAEHLKLPYLPLALGGRSDSKLLTGTSRGWAGGEPTPLLRLMLQHRTASGLVLLDEIDKVGASERSGAPTTSVLLGLLELETATRWQDTFLQTTCDFSRLSFWATANSLKPLPAPLLSRFTILYMPEPKPEHMGTLVQGITDDISREWRLPLGVLPLAPRLVYEGARFNARELRRMIMRFLSDWAYENRRPERLH